VIASADYQHVEQDLLKKEERNYGTAYWDKKVMAPSSLIFYLGINKKIKNLEHHNLFFDTDFNKHAAQIYNDPQWPDDPLFYVCCPSKTDSSVAPEGMENLFILIPIAAGLKDDVALHEKYFAKVMTRLEKICDDKITDHIIYKKSYCLNDFIADYNAFKGNAYGLANTLTQTAVFKPSIKNKHLDNLIYTGQLTVPGPGVPPAIISGKIASNEVEVYLNSSIVKN
jgi:phytoene desaturase